MHEHDDAPRETLLKLLECFAKNWLAHDGCWFLACEEKYGLETAIEHDIKSWERFSPIEAKRIMQAFEIEEGGGLEALEKALTYRLYSFLNRQQAETSGDGKLIYTMVDCRVQSARERKNLPLFPCKPVGIVEYTKFAETIDARIQTRCLGCPPDKNDGFYCRWEFKLKE
ncbi:MAG: DUF6125 family protein [Planctomycetota bacterium]|jgi:hypothetical protein